MSEEEIIPIDMGEPATSEPRTGAIPWLRPRQLLRGAIGAIPEGVTGLVGLAIPSVAEYSNRIGRELDEQFRVPQSSWRDDPTGAVVQNLGAALVGLPAGGIGSAYSLASRLPAFIGGSRVGRATVGALEAATPLTLPLTPGMVALNTGVATGAQAGIEALADAATGSSYIPIDMGDTRPATPAAVGSAGATLPSAQVDESVIPVDMDAQAGELPVVVERAPNQTARTALGYAGTALGAGMVGLMGLGAARQLRAVREADRLADAGLTAPGPAALPNIGEQSIVERIETQAFGNTTAITRRLDEQVDAGILTREMADHYRSIAEIGTNMTVTQQRIIESAKTGILPDGTRTVPLQQLYEQVAALSPARRQQLADGIAAADEMNMRDANTMAGRLATQATGPAGNISPNGAATSLFGWTDTQLRQMARSTDADPELGPIRQQVRDINESMRNVLVNMGGLTPNEANLWSLMHPDYMHRLYSETMPKRARQFGTPLTSGIDSNSPMRGRSYAEGSGPAKAQDPMSALSESFRMTLDFAMTNQARAQLLQQLHVPIPGQPQFVGRRLTSANDAVQPGFIGLQVREKGQRVRYEVVEPLAEVLEHYPKLAVPFLNGTRKLVQNFSTGPGAALVGTPFAMTSAAYSGVATTLSRAQGTSAGIVDKAMQTVTNALTGRPLGVRGDPTFILQAAYRTLADTSATISEAVAGTLRRSILNDGMLSRTLGAQRAERIAQSAQQAYEESWQAVMRREGVAGSGLTYAPDDVVARNVTMRALSPELQSTSAYLGRGATISDIKGWGDFTAYMQRVADRAIPAKAARTWQLIASINDVIASSPQSAYFVQNANRIGVTRAAGAARRVAGDPAQYGSSRGVQAVTSMSPYMNVALQSLHAYSRAWREAPIAFPLGLAGFVGMTQLVSLQSAIIADEDNIANHLPPNAVMHWMTQPIRDQVGAMNVYLPGVRPEFSIRMPYDLAITPAVAVTRSVLAGLFDIGNPRFWTPEFEPIREALTRVIEDNRHEGIAESLGMAGLRMELPPPVELFGRVALGADFSNALDFTKPRMYAPRDVGAPGYERNRLPGDTLNRHVEATIEAFFGGAAVPIIETIRHLGMADDPATAITESYTLRAAQGQRMFAPLFQQERQIGPNDALGATVRPAEDTLARIVAGRGDIDHSGTVGSGDARDVPEFGPGRSGVTPEMEDLLTDAAELYNDMREERNTRKSLMDSVLSAQADPRLRSNPAALRDQINNLNRQVREINSGIYDRIVQWEEEQTRLTGRRIRLRDLKPDEGIDQFATVQ